MKKKLYDNYDYEEAYQKQIANLEEWELERLMKDGKVECLYRTTTTKSKNIKSGTTLLEAQVYPSFKDKKDVPVTKKKRETRPSQKNLKDWTHDQRSSRTSVITGLNGYSVYNKKHYQLTHLLEKGHQLRKGGRKVGNVKAFEHIAPVNETLGDLAVSKIRQKVRG